MSKTIKIPNKKQIIYSGKTKDVCDSKDEDTLILHYKDNVTLPKSFKNKKKKQSEEKITGKGAICKKISEYIFSKLNDAGITNHFIKSINRKDQLVHRLDMIMLEVKVRNVAAGRLCRDLKMQEGMILPRGVVEFAIKSENLGDPVIGEDYITALQLASPNEIDDMKISAIRVNDFLRGLFLGAGIRLVDFKLEFGRIPGTEMVVLADEISPDTCRLWNVSDNQKFDKDLFLEEPEMLIKRYKEVAKRLAQYL